MTTIPKTIKFKRFFPSRGPSGAVIFSAIACIMYYGFSEFHKSSSERREINREKTWNRLFLVPLLLAETDRDLMRRLDSIASKEEKVMGDNWIGLGLKNVIEEIGEPVYYTKRHVNPTYVLLEKEDTISAQWWRGSKMFTKNPPYHEREDWKGVEDPIGN